MRDQLRNNVIGEIGIDIEPHLCELDAHVRVQLPRLDRVKKLMIDVGRMDRLLGSRHAFAESIKVAVMPLLFSVSAARRASSISIPATNRDDMRRPMRDCSENFLTVGFRDRAMKRGTQYWHLSSGTPPILAQSAMDLLPIAYAEMRESILAIPDHVTDDISFRSMMLPMSFYLGIDAGGTKTVCILGDESRTLARATGGSIKHMRVGERQAALNLQQVVKEALTKWGSWVKMLRQVAWGRREREFLPSPRG